MESSEIELLWSRFTDTVKEVPIELVRIQLLRAES